ncbi:MAG: hypothetical protein KZQ75_12715 [Candidatus Thiodiazotropha sp. (ex Myrtea spinifera)]|nr:hypothetical protein [Candidatus Thiodiazotropha sp. (ex Myrtea spinifera)]
MYRLIFIPIIAGLISGCSIKHDYVWEEYKIKPSRVILTKENKNPTPEDRIAIISGSSDTNKILLGHLKGNAHYWYGSLQNLSDAIVTQLSEELTKLNYTVDNNSKKSVIVNVTGYSTEIRTWTHVYIIDLELTLGNGYVTTFHIRNPTPLADPKRGINGAVALATIAILNTMDFSEYLD